MRQVFKRRGFTLVELLSVVLILGAIAAVALPRVVASADSAKEKACKNNIGIINSQTELYNAVAGGYPKTIDVLTKNPNYFPDGMPVCALKGKYSLNSSHRAVCSHSASSKPIPVPTPIPAPIPAKPVASPFK
jgi:prepilin-type N-terminal cleavage/methylation domain-containing protein